ncbi:MAG: hypothetical protein KAS36_15510 [Anaerolineales bacterium]|nr:hypothetical protein [Anaerolineales bacterium]
MIWILLWLVVGYLSAAYLARYGTLKDKPITLNHLTALISIGLLGPMLTLVIIINTMIEFYDEHGETVIFRKEKKEE